jgi:hypothetical protein
MHGRVVESAVLPAAKAERLLLEELRAALRELHGRVRTPGRAVERRGSGEEVREEIGRVASLSQDRATAAGYVKCIACERGQ